MILVDTSVLIAYLKKQNIKSVEQFEYILDKKLSYGINTFIYQEILQLENELNQVREVISNYRLLFSE